MEKQVRDEKIELYGNGYFMLLDTLKDIPKEMWKFKASACSATSQDSVKQCITPPTALAPS